MRLFIKNLPFAPVRSIKVAPIQLHALVLAAFASLIAPFGGFFASGVKRAFKIKDFADAIPGHGGLTDRMDCQFIMGVFSSMYFHSFIWRSGATVGGVLQYALLNLEMEQLQTLYSRLGQYLEGQGALGG
jgi:phosphatidate cytidylyltransferase